MEGHDMAGHDMGAASNHHMWMWFHTTINDTILFEPFTVTTIPQMLFACIIIATIGFLYEYLKHLRWKHERCAEPADPNIKYATFPSEHVVSEMIYVRRLFHKHHLAQTALFGIQMIVSYILMLVFMTFSVWLAIAICIGVSFGYYIFGIRSKSRCSNGSDHSQEIH